MGQFTKATIFHAVANRIFQNGNCHHHNGHINVEKGEKKEKIVMNVECFFKMYINLGIPLSFRNQTTWAA